MKKDFTSAKGFDRFSSAFSGSTFGFSQSDINAIQQYNNLIRSGTEKSIAFSTAMAGASTSAKNLVRESKSATVGVNGLAAAERTATVVTQLFSAALNMGLTMGITYLLSKITEEIEEIAHAGEKARESAEKSREAAQTSVEAYASESKNMAELTAEYVKLYTTTSDLSLEKERLIEIQKRLNKNISDQQKRVDLLNLSLEENLRLIRESNYEEAKAQSNEILPEYRKAVARENSYNTSFEKLTNSELGKKVADNIEEEFLDYFESVTDQLEVESKNPITGEIKKEYKNILDRRTDILGLNASGTGDSYDEYLKELDQIIELYKTWDGASNAVYQDLTNLRAEVKSVSIADKELIAQSQELEQLQNDYELIDPQIEARIDSILTKVGGLERELNQTNGAVAKSTLARQIANLRDEAYNLAGTNSVLKKSVDDLFGSYNSQINDVIENTSNLRAAWFTTYEDFEKEEGKTIDTLTKAMQTLAEGNKLAKKDFFDIFALDTDQVLRDIEMVNGEVSVSLESLQELKDSYIKKQIETYQGDIEAIRSEHADELEEFERYKGELEQIQIEIAEKNIDLAKTVFGNIDTDTRKVLEWTDDNLQKYASAIKSWGMTQEELEGTISTVLGTTGKYDGIEIAFSPMLQTPNGAVLLSKGTVDKYINSLLSSLGENWSREDLFRLDAQGLEVDGIKIKNMLADIGDSAQRTSEIMHYLGRNGSLATAAKAFEMSSKAAEEFNDVIYNDTVMIEYLNSLLGYTINQQKALKELSEKANKQAEGLLKAQQYRIDEIIDGITEEKTAIEDVRDALKEELNILEEQGNALKKIKEDYENVSDVVTNVIQEQIDALKAQNDEREEAIDLAEKLANLENAKNNKVRTYTEAGGWTYEAKKVDVQQAEKELADAQNDAEIKKIEEYLKKWQKRENKAEKAASERTAEAILGADWREKIAEQDEEIFDMYDEEYQKYCEQLYQVTEVEMETLKKQIEAKDKEVDAKDKQIKSWQRYKTEVTNAANKAKVATEDWYQYLSQVTIKEGSTLEEREANMSNFVSEYGKLVEQIASYSSQIQGLTMSVPFDTDNLKTAAQELADFFESYRDGVEAMAKAYDEDSNHFGLISSAWDEQLLKAAKGMRLVGSGSQGSVVDKTGLFAVHGTKQKAETLFNANDSAKLYDLVHNTPNLVASILSDGTKIASNLNPQSSDVGVTFNGTVINLPNVQNAEQFARQMEAYMQSVLSESQVYKPKR